MRFTPVPALLLFPFVLLTAQSPSDDADIRAVIEETFSDIVIDTDGATASVAFHFEFLLNGKAANVGREHWLLVKTATGWKIAAATWSRNTPPKESG